MNIFETPLQAMLKQSRIRHIKVRGATRPTKVKAEPIVAEVKIGRNDPCPCGSGRKYKLCCGKDIPEMEE